MIINAGLERVVFLGDYPDDLATAVAAEAGLAMLRMPEPAPGGLP
jgi:phosphoglycolate phosphatase-like HAD superfamily hydrolase